MEEKESSELDSQRAASPPGWASTIDGPDVCLGLGDPEPNDGRSWADGGTSCAPVVSPVRGRPSTLEEIPSGEAKPDYRGGEGAFSPDDGWGRLALGGVFPLRRIRTTTPPRIPATTMPPIRSDAWNGAAPVPLLGGVACDLNVIDRGTGGPDTVIDPLLGVPVYPATGPSVNGYVPFVTVKLIIVVVELIRDPPSVIDQLAPPPKGKPFSVKVSLYRSSLNVTDSLSDELFTTNEPVPGAGAYTLFDAVTV